MSKNPRRAYDSEGQEIRPPTIERHLRDGYRTLEAWCGSCGHEAVVDVTGLPPHLPIPDVILEAPLLGLWLPRDLRASQHG